MRILPNFTAVHKKMFGPKKPTPEQLAWQLAHPQDDLRPNLVTVSVVCPILALIFVGLRLWSREILHGRLRLDLSDWLCLVALFLFIAYDVAVGLSTTYGFGRHVAFVTDVRMLQILSIAAEVLYLTVVALLKLSILSLYRRLFRRNRWFIRTTWLVGFVAVAVACVGILTSSVQCIPISAIWTFDRGEGVTCINYGLAALMTYIINILLDLAIFFLPLPIVTDLQLPSRKKWMLGLNFAAGGSASIVSIVQLKYITRIGSTADTSCGESFDAEAPAHHYGIMATQRIELTRYVNRGGVWVPLHDEQEDA
ncbi:hypothetical protein GGR56DRAFT_691773 [Xylariaceae sp. FL0804]|nr:hypothetical protein GGR56DRAFT_691773 [Xylariaceae sp. FL0804]